jgi:2-aminoadipate transaminase
LTDLRYAARAANAVPFIPLLQTKSDMLKLSAGNAFPGALPDVAEEAHAAVTALRNETLQYGPLYGLDDLRDAIAAFVGGTGLRPSARTSWW